MIVAHSSAEAAAKSRCQRGHFVKCLNTVSVMKLILSLLCRYLQDHQGELFHESAYSDD